MFHILIAGYDKNERKKWQQLLKNSGFMTSQAANGEDILKILESKYIDLLLLGAKIDGCDAFNLVNQLKDTSFDTLIVMIDGNPTKENLRKAYISGTDEYLKKDVDQEEFLFRIQALLRRAGKSYKFQLKIGEVFLDAKSMSVVRGDKRTTLPKKEFLLLYKLLSYPGTIFTRTQLMDEIWGLTSESDASTLNVHINRLRKKFRDYPEFELKAVRGIGYKAEIQ